MTGATLVGKVFEYELPTKKGRDCATACRMLKDEKKFIDRLLEMDGCWQVEGPDITGSYHISFDVCEMTLDDEGVIKEIEALVENIGFEEE